MFVTILIAALLIIYTSKGYKDGFFSEAVGFIGLILIFVLSFLLKNPISELMYSHLPFFNFLGVLDGLVIINILGYELFAFLTVGSILLTIYTIIIKATNIFDRLVNLTLIFNLPFRILGMLVGLVEGVFVTFVILFIGVQIRTLRAPIMENQWATLILEETPVLADASKPIYNSLNEIYDVAEMYKDKDKDDKDEANLKSLDIMLKYKIIKAETAKKLIDNGKIKIPNADILVNDYIEKENNNIEE